MEQEVEKLRSQLKKQEKMASLGLLSAGIAHEIQNPLNFVINFSKLSGSLLNDLVDIIEANREKFDESDLEDVDDIVGGLKENMQKILEHSERAVSIIRGILLVSRGKDGEFLPTDVCKLVKEYVWLSYHAMRANNKTFNISIHETYQADIPPVQVIPQDLSRAVLNVMNNACYAVWLRQQTADDSYSPKISVSVSAADGQLVISIGDNGVGMTDDEKLHLYENFFTTKPIGQGTGLGMAITKEIIEQKHGGSITFDSTVGEGTCFTFTIPIKS